MEGTEQLASKRTIRISFTAEIHCPQHTHSKGVATTIQSAERYRQPFKRTRILDPDASQTNFR